MASKVLSIEIGQDLTRVAELDYKAKNPKIYNIFTLKTPPDMVNDGNVNINSVFVSQLGNALNRRSISTKKVIFVMNSSRVANRVIQIPFVKPNRVAGLIAANASDYFPVDMDQYQLVHEVMGTIEDGSSKQLQVSVLAVPRDLIHSYRLLAKACELSLEGIDYIGNSIKKMMIREIPETIKATLKVEENSSIFTVIEDGIVKLQRTLNYGVAEAIEATIESQLFGYALDTLETVEQLTQKQLLYTSLDYEQAGAGSSEESKLEALRAENTDSFRNLIGSTARNIDYFQSQNPDHRIERIYLIGLGSAVNGLAQLMGNELNCSVVAGQQCVDLAFVKGAAGESARVAEYFTAIGAATEPVSILPNAKNAKPSKAKASSAGGSDEDVEDAAPSGGISWPAVVLITGVCLIAAGGLAAYSFFTHSMLESENSLLNAQVKNYSYIEDVVAEYNAAKANDDWATQVKNVTSSDNDNLVEFIEELETRMPSEINILTLSASESGVTLNIEVTSMPAVADVVSQLRTFETIAVSGVSTIASATDDAGNTTVSFSVNCIYTELSASEDENEEGTTETPESSDTTETAVGASGQ
jgi:type IV pilus assembly protein PilM